MLLRFIPLLIAVGFSLIPAGAQQRVITTIAGTDWLFPGDGRPAVNAPLGGADFGLDVKVDANGNYYICDGDNRMVMRVGPDGIVNVIAGNGFAFKSANEVLAVNASLSLPTAIALDSSGNLFIADLLGNIRKVTRDGIIHAFAGTGQSGFGGDNGPALGALFNDPYGLAVDLAGNVYIADTYNNRVRIVSPGGIITTFAGNGQEGRGGDGGQAVNAQLKQPGRLAIDSAGNLYISETLNQRVRKVDTHGVITTVAGGGCDRTNPSTGCSVADGASALSEPVIPVGIVVDAGGNLFIADLFTGGIRKVDPQGKIRTVAGNGQTGFSGDGGPALNASFYFQLRASLALDPSGNLLVGDDLNQRVRKITLDGNVNTIAGNGLFHLSGNGGPATSASIDNPTGVVTDNSGNIYFTEQLLSRIRRVTPDGAISVYAGNGTRGYSGDNGPAAQASLSFPQYLAFDSNGNLYFSDSLNSVVRKIDGNGVITTYAGNGTLAYGGDNGPALKASFMFPSGLTFDGANNLIIADNQDNRIRIVFANGIVNTLAGDGTPGYTGDNGVSPKSRVNGPVGVRGYATGIYFSDQGNQCIRRIDLNTLIITTVAGNGKAGYTGDGGLATNASLNFPSNVDFDSAGNMYIADTRNGVIRIVDSKGVINTFAGANKRALGDGGPAIDAGIGSPVDVWLDANDRVLISDPFFNRIRAVLTTPPSFQASPANLAFTVPAGSTPVDQQIDLIGSIPGVLYSASAASSGWFSVSPANGSMPTALRVSVDPSKVSPGPYSGTVTITGPNASPSTRTVTVALTVTAAGQPSLNLRPGSMTFSFVQGAVGVTRPLSVSNVGGGSISFNVVTANTAGLSWLSATPSSGLVNAFASTPVSVTANPSGLKPGTYSGTVTVSSTNPAQSVTVAITMTISAVPQTILIPQTGLTFFTVEGGGAPPPQFFNILNTRAGQMSWTTNFSTLSGGNWLTAFPGGGVSDANSPIVPQVRVDVNPTGLQRGVYYGSVQVIAPSADNNQQFVSVILDVLPPGSNIGPLVQPIGLIFSAVAGGVSPGSQSILVQNLNSTPLTFSSGRVTVDGNNWFTSLPPDGAVTQAQPVRIVIQPQITGLAAGVYRGSLTLSFSDGSVRNVALVLVLIPPGSTLPTGGSNSFRDAQNACTTKLLAPVFTLLSDGFSVPAGFPTQVAIKVVDNCANPMTTGSVVTSFSNGDSSIPLISLKDGTWAGTWQPQNKTAQVQVTGAAQVPEQSLTGTVHVNGSFQTQAPDTPPVVPMNAVANAASGTLQVSPGTIISVYGTKLATGVAVAGNLPLPTNLLNSSVNIAGSNVPLIFVSDGQVNAIVPYGISVNTDHQVAVIRGSSLSGPQHLTVGPTSPGIFTTSQTGKGQGIIVDIANNIVDQNHPVRAGDAIVIYCTGLGEVSPPVPNGKPAPPSPLSSAVNPVTVNIGGVTVNPFFAGLTPGFPGLYQVNAIVPAGITPGNQVPVFLTQAGQVSMPVTIAIR
ncbi:MAG: hypothetical protein M3O35_19160 [Acidobacteriota bacterium]|nr:hypothetical protein [Acidobacteriota bacterium]